MAIELETLGFKVNQQHQIQVYYRKREVGEYFADLLIDDLIIIEIKATRHIAEDNEAQLLNYLKATIYEVGLLFNFGVKPEFERKLFNNDKKGHLKWIASDSNKTTV